MTSRAGDLRIVPVDGSNVDQFLELIAGLAEYEKLPPPDQGARARLARDATSDPPPFQARIALLDGVPSGFLSYYYGYSTFLGRPTLYLEDIFVREEHRHKGVGKEMFKYCVREAQAKGCGRIDWTALQWNLPAHRFYEGLGGKRMEWCLFRLAEEDFGRALSDEEC